MKQRGKLYANRYYVFNDFWIKFLHAFPVSRKCNNWKRCSSIPLIVHRKSFCSLFWWTNADSHGIHSNKLRGDSYLIRSRYRMLRKIQSPRGIRILCWHCHKSWNNRNPDRCWGCSHSRLHRHSWCRTLRYHHYRMNNHIAVRRWGYNYWRYYLWRDLLVAQLFFCYSPGHFENCCCFDFLRYFFHSHYDADFDW